MKCFLVAAVAAMGIGGAAQAATAKINYANDLWSSWGSFSFSALYDYETGSVVDLYELSVYTYYRYSGSSYDGGRLWLDLDDLSYRFSTNSGVHEDAFLGMSVASPYSESGQLDPDFLAIAPVPLPAGAVLLPAALLGFGALRRCKRS